MIVSPLVLREWVKEIRARDMKGLKSLVSRARSSRVVNGERVERASVELSGEGRAMLFDAQARLSRMRVEDGHPEPACTVGREDVIGKAIDHALRALKEGSLAGERRYRIVEHPPGAFEFVGGHVGKEFVLLRAERARFRLKIAPPENVEDVLARLKERHGVESDDPLAIAEKALEGFSSTKNLSDGVLESEKRPLANALVEEVRRFVRTEKEVWYRVARTLVLLEELRVPDWRSWVASEIDRSLSVVSELLSCGLAARKFPAIADALESGRLTWTKVRTLAAHIDEKNIEKLGPLLAACTSRELETLRSALARSEGSRPEGDRRCSRDRKDAGISPAAGVRKRPILPPLEFELSPGRWRQVEELVRVVGKRLGRGIGTAEAIEEALWLFLVAIGAPAPLWKSYRIVIHHDRGTGFSWMVGPGGIVAVPGDELSRIRGLDTEVYDIEKEIEAAEKDEKNRLAGVPSKMLSREDALQEEIRRALAAMAERAPKADDPLRRAIYLRDGGRCSVCGCHAALYVQVHHVDPRAEGGGNDPANLALVCTRCHSLAHSNYARLVPREPHPPLIFRIEVSEKSPGPAKPQVRSPIPATPLVAELALR
ncbi:MAG: HNH endonuclease [Planctomycetes bacterium]|nr:HNH endonuclease [Planctomycetota bacterium]